MVPCIFMFVSLMGKSQMFPKLKAKSIFELLVFLIGRKWYSESTPSENVFAEFVKATLS